MEENKDNVIEENEEIQYNGRTAKRKRENKKKKKILLLNILIVIFIIIFIISAIVIAKWYITTEKSKKQYDELATTYATVEEDDSLNGTIDFDELESINSDIKAWIKVEGTNIDYPVVQTTDNSYYLKNNFYKEYDKSGTLFFDYTNEITDKNLVIYGHNIKRGTMFADLVDVYEGNLGDDVNIYLYTSDRTMSFKVFSSYCTTPDESIYNTSITDDEFYSFLEKLKNESEREFVGDQSLCSQILTLSTCDSTGKKRIIVHAELEKLVFTNNKIDVQ